MNIVYQDNKNISNQSIPQSIPQYSDNINQLPSDTELPSHEEITFVDNIFKKKKGVFDKILSETKDILFVGILFCIFSIPQLDDLIKKFIKITQTSPYILIIIKSLLFMLFYFIFNFFYLSKK